MKTIVVWFSCGAASAVASKIVIEKYAQTHNIIVANTDVTEENRDNRRFLDDVTNWINHPIVDVWNEKYGTKSAEEVWERERYMSSPSGATCTRILKKEARYQFELMHRIDWHVMGYCLEEAHRHDRFVKYERSNLLPVLIDEKLSKEDCFNLVEGAGIVLPEAYRKGYPNANCIGCVKATSPTYWNHVRKMDPYVFARRAEQSRRLGCRLVRYKGKRIFLDELPEDAIGRKMKSPECSLFCSIT